MASNASPVALGTPYDSAFAALLQLAITGSCSESDCRQLEQLVASDPGDYHYLHYLPILHHGGVHEHFPAALRETVRGVYRKSFVQYSQLQRELGVLRESLAALTGAEVTLMLGAETIAQRAYPEAPVRWCHDSTVLAVGLPFKLRSSVLQRLPGQRLVYDNGELCVFRSDAGLSHTWRRCLPSGLAAPAVNADGAQASNDLLLLLSILRLGSAPARHVAEQAILDACMLLARPPAPDASYLSRAFEALDDAWPASAGLERLMPWAVQQGLHGDTLASLRAKLRRGAPRVIARARSALWRRPARLAAQPGFSRAQYFAGLVRRQLEGLR